MSSTPPQAPGHSHSPAARLDVLAMLRHYEALLADPHAGVTGEQVHAHPFTAGEVRHVITELERDCGHTIRPATQSPGRRSGEQMHVSRTRYGNALELGCPCAKAPCGMVIWPGDPRCLRHAPDTATSMERIHSASQCPEPLATDLRIAYLRAMHASPELIESARRSTDHLSMEPWVELSRWLRLWFATHDTTRPAAPVGAAGPGASAVDAEGAS